MLHTEGPSYWPKLRRLVNKGTNLQSLRHEDVVAECLRRGMAHSIANLRAIPPPKNIPIDLLELFGGHESVPLSPPRSHEDVLLIIACLLAEVLETPLGTDPTEGPDPTPDQQKDYAALWGEAPPF
jgi:hypothetical protein